MTGEEDRDPAKGPAEVKSGYQKNRAGGPRKGKPWGRFVKAEGKIEELKNYVFDNSDGKGADRFIRTKEQIAHYVSKEMGRYGYDMEYVVETMKEPILQKPEKLGEDADETDKEIWKHECKEYVERKSALAGNLRKLYTILWGQCSEWMQAELKGLDSFRITQLNRNAIELLKNIRATSHSHKTQMNKAHALVKRNIFIHSIKQGRYQSNAQWHTYFINQVNTMAGIGGLIGAHPELVAEEERKLRVSLEIDPSVELEKEEIKECQEAASRRYLAALFLENSDESRYEELVRGLHNSHIHGEDKYPKTVTESLKLINNWKGTPKRRQMMKDGVQFAQTANEDLEEGEEDQETTLVNSGKRNNKRDKI
eukprot:CAMPEP_0118708552 /NCGR_PEP_ID=MMETSP0800-20121206/21974_1 /TAXON_ID=210618 ORGANISM="Striatella unipunctata, Strain CCMP2910" /NCGR_SAMPLE_ID=MMETSP0800 /ASSEMBLY_ACC=CAM_ASM_000638 /LENGTH=366 /DNA_ID=CAMNT_0006611805 /DNA_START=53 /DNA_END=1150 /DNA_ORIENTATION=+